MSMPGVLDSPCVLTFAVTASRPMEHFQVMTADQATHMDARTAVSTAKAHVEELFGSEGVFNLGLEEIEFDETNDRWFVTVGFSRSWDKKQGVMADLSPAERTYKVVMIDKDGRVRSVKNRETASAG
ncbi:MAG TPA: hypothetical protein VHX39_34790 [Acetobacteraceae bacterium]|nr:hypothetical protein [Acetobacteraceae bacterium]